MGVVNGFYLKGIRSLGIKMRNPNTATKSSRKTGIAKAVTMLKK